MRVRSVVLFATAAVTAAVVAPASASAAVSQCSFVMPTKLVINEPEEYAEAHLASNCTTNGADQAAWDFGPSTGGSIAIAFTPEDFAEGDTSGYIVIYDIDPKVTYTATPAGAQQADGDPLTQNTPSMVVKYGATLAAPVTRTSTKLTWAATAKGWSGATSSYRPRAGVSVSLFHQTSSSAAWTYVKSVTTSSTGKATVTLNSPKAGNYRLATGETPSVWASYSTAIKGRV